MKSIIAVVQPVVFYLFAASSCRNNNVKIRYQENLKGTNIFYIDGYNVLGHAGTANNSTALANKLSQVVEPRSNTIILVFDGPKAPKSTTTTTSSASSLTMAVDDDTASIEKAALVTSSSSSSSIPTADIDNTMETTIEILNPYGTFQRVTLGTGLLADDYILNEIRAMEHHKNMNVLSSLTIEIDQNHHPIQSTITTLTSRNIVQVVTADRKLRQQVLAIKPNKVKGVINPVTFWKRYIPRLCGLKNK